MEPGLKFRLRIAYQVVKKAVRPDERKMSVQQMLTDADPHQAHQRFIFIAGRCCLHIILFYFYRFIRLFHLLIPPVL